MEQEGASAAAVSKSIHEVYDILAKMENGAKAAHRALEVNAGIQELMKAFVTVGDLHVVEDTIYEFSKKQTFSCRTSMRRWQRMTTVSIMLRMIFSMFHMHFCPAKSFLIC